MRALAVAGALAVSLARLAGAAPALPVPGPEPSIEEMIAAIEAVRGAPERRGAGSDGADPDVRGSPSQSHAGPSGPPEGAAAVLKAARARCTLRAAFYSRHKMLSDLAYLYMRFENYAQAVRTFNELYRKKTYLSDRSPVPGADRLVSRGYYYRVGRHGWTYGYYEMQHARALAALGEEKAARFMLAQVAAKQERVGYLPSILARDLKETREFVEACEANLRALDELQAAYSEGPSADTAHDIVRLCAPDSNKVVKPLTWYRWLLTLAEEFPESRVVRAGNVHWELSSAHREFEMHEKSVEILDELSARFPGNAHVENGNVLWEKAESYVRLGLLQEELGDRSAPLAYREAVETFELFKEAFPKDRRNNTTRSSSTGRIYPPLVDRRLAPLRAALARF